MRSRKVIVLTLSILAILMIVAWGLPRRGLIVLVLTIGINLLCLIFRLSTPEARAREIHARSIGRYYRPRPTDAGRWVDAPIAEVDKSTVGKLLASRMRREPGLRVVVRKGTAESHPASTDGLYDPELDG